MDALQPATIRSLSQDPDRVLHFVGIAGAGMSALADYRLQARGRVSGSDRFFDQGKMVEERARLEGRGAEIGPQNGALVAMADLIVASTAVEAQIPDLVEARRLGKPIAHRAALLANHVASRPTLAIAGTSGKSTVVGMLFAALRAAGRDPGCITGGELGELADHAWRGNGWCGSGPLVIEADESDRSLVHYSPEVGVVLNLHKDHGGVDEVMPAFAQFCAQSAAIVVSEDENLRPLADHALVFGTHQQAGFRATGIEAGRSGTVFRIDGCRVTVPMPGHHNMLNALAALAACRALDVDLADAAEGIASFRGVARRFDLLGSRGGVEVIDDFAHNPAKIHAAMTAARRRGKRLLAVFQPHGFSPTKFMRRDYVEAARDALGCEDRILLQEIFYAGGTVTKDISSADLCADMQEAGVDAAFFPEREALIAELAHATVAGDTILVMGARDPSLAAFARSVLAALGDDEATSTGR